MPVDITYLCTAQCAGMRGHICNLNPVIFMTHLKWLEHPHQVLEIILITTHFRGWLLYWHFLIINASRNSIYTCIESEGKSAIKREEEPQWVYYYGSGRWRKQQLAPQPLFSPTYHLLCSRAPVFPWSGNGLGISAQWSLSDWGTFWGLLIILNKLVNSII